MVITNLQEKENRKIWVPIRGGNRGGWSLFDWEKVREMPYRDREMYLGNSAKIGVLDKGGKWRKKDWYLHKQDLESGEALNHKMAETIRKDQQRMNAALGITEIQEVEDKLTPAELQLLLKKIRGNKEDFVQEKDNAIGLGFDKAKVQIRAKPTAKKQDNPHKLEGTEIIKEQQKPKKKQKKQQKKDPKKQRRRSPSSSSSSSEGSCARKTRQLRKELRDRKEDRRAQREGRSRQRSRSRDRKRQRQRIRRKEDTPGYRNRSSSERRRQQRRNRDRLK